MKLKIPAILAATFGLLSSAYLALGLYEHKSHAAAPTGGTITGLLCPGYGYYTLGNTCPPPDTGSLAFSDLITGPDTGIGDGLGSGVIVTVWGYDLGSTQGASTIEFCDSLGACRAGYVYYWKDADGTLPGGPADLSSSHGMQEIAFSIPDSAVGAGFIKVTVSGAASTLPFTVRPGNIYHVKSTGNDGSGDGSWGSPWLTVAQGDSIATAGDTLYVHDVDTGAYNVRRAIYNNKGFTATTDNQMAYVSYPNTRPTVSGHQNVWTYNTKGIVVSKLDVYSSNCVDETLNSCATTGGSDGIGTTENGRVIGNKVTDIAGGCATGASGAISGSHGKIGNAKIFGNYIHDYGCPNTDKLHHTTYFTLRDNDNNLSVPAWEVGWNHLKDNHARMGIHHYDEDNSGAGQCGDATTTLKIHDNVITSQAASAIHFESSCNWSMPVEIYNNVIVDAGLAHDISCTSNCSGVNSAIIVQDGALLSNVSVYNNTVYGWNSTDFGGGVKACFALKGGGNNVTVTFNDNTCYQTTDKPFVVIQEGSMADNITGSGNSFFTTVSNPSNAIAPTWDATKITTDPQLTLTGQIITLSGSSPLKNQSSTTLGFDIYGAARGATSSVGAVE